MSMNKIHRAYRAIIYTLYVKLYYSGEIFTNAMESHIKEVEHEVEMHRRGSVLHKKPKF